MKTAEQLISELLGEVSFIINPTLSGKIASLAKKFGGVADYSDTRAGVKWSFKNTSALDNFMDGLQELDDRIMFNVQPGNDDKTIIIKTNRL